MVEKADTVHDITANERKEHDPRSRNVALRVPQSQMKVDYTPVIE
jgi:hypothetical protein